MKVLFVLQYPGYLRYFDSVLELLCQRGHRVAVAFDQPHKQPEGLAALDTIDGTVEVLDPVPPRRDIWGPVARGVRGTIDYARYLHPRFKNSPYLRDRMRTILPRLTRGLGRWTTTTAERTSGLIRLLQVCERAVPSNSTLETYLRRVNPDVLVVSPLVTDQCPQVDLIKAARQVGVRSALCVASWDHLTTKGLMRIQPDLVAVWNHGQRQEALDFHGAEDDRIVVTGAQCFDRWFDRRPRRARDEFCRHVGLQPDRPFVVFTGSTASISAPEAELGFVTRWIEAMRGGPGTLRDVGILIRPHPYNSKQWKAVDLTPYPNVVVYPRHGANPVDDNDRADYYDTLHHGAAVVGINTSAMIEAGIQNRPVFTVVDSSFDDTQTGTLHFRYLLPENGGHLQRAASLEEHARQLAVAIDGADVPSAQEFIETFVRPYGTSEPATPRLVVALEQLSVTDPNPATPLSLRLRPVQAVLWLIACVVALSNVHEVRKSFRRALHRCVMVMWQFFKNKRKYFRKLRAELQLWKSLRRAQHRYAMVVWEFYKTRREGYRKWHERRSRRSKKVRQSRSRGGMA